MIDLIKPNYAVKALIPYPYAIKEADGYGLFRRADAAVCSAFAARKRLYNFLLLSFFVFTALGFFYYRSAAEGLEPLSLYLPVRQTGDVTLQSLLLFRRLHLLASFFLFLSGFTVFGLPLSLLFIGSDAFVIGFSLKYAMDYLINGATYGNVLGFIFCMAVFAILDILLTCEAIRYSRYACGGLKEMLKARRVAGYVSALLLILIFNIVISYIFTFISI